MLGRCALVNPDRWGIIEYMEILHQNETELEYVPVHEDLDIVTEMLKYISPYTPIPDIEMVRRGLERQLQTVGALPHEVKNK